MLTWFDDFTVRMLKYAVRQFRFVTGTKIEKHIITFQLEKFNEQLRIAKDSEGNYIFDYTYDDKSKIEKIQEDSMTLKNLNKILGLLIYTN